MNLFRRVSDIISANLNDLIDGCEEPETMLRLAVREMDAALDAAMDGAAKVLASEKRLARQKEAQQADAARWRRQAEEAIRRGDDEAARRALARHIDHAAIAAALDDQWHAARTAGDRLRRQIGALRARLAEARLKLATLAARQQTAAVQKRLAKTLGGRWFDDSALGRFERLAERVDQAEAEAEALLELTGLMDETADDTARADIDAQLRELKAACGRETT